MHSWGGPVGMMANYHAALACGAPVAECPMPAYILRDVMCVEPWKLENGFLTIPDVPGLGIHLDKETEKKYAFKEDAVYSCLPAKGFEYNEETWATSSS